MDEQNIVVGWCVKTLRHRGIMTYKQALYTVHEYRDLDKIDHSVKLQV